MSTFAERLKRARLAAGMSQAALAKAVKTGQSTIGSLESGRSQSSGLAVQIAEALGVNPMWLATGEGPMSTTSVAQLPPGGEVRTWRHPEDLDNDGERRVWVQSYDTRFSAGDGQIHWEVRQRDALPFRENFFEAVGCRPEHCRMLINWGDSMEPFLFHKDAFMVCTDRTTVKDGRVYALYLGDEALVKQVFREVSGITLHSYNPRYPDKRIAAADMEHVRIIGEVIYRSGAGHTGA